MYPKELSNERNWLVHQYLLPNKHILIDYRTNQVSHTIDTSYNHTVDDCVYNDISTLNTGMDKFLLNFIGSLICWLLMSIDFL